MKSNETLASARTTHVRVAERKRCFTFSFAEAVLSIGVISILSVMLMPALNEARTASHRSTCEFNLFAIGMALKAYADDHDIYPFAAEPVVSTLRHAGYLKSADDIRCPMDVNREGNTYSNGYLGGHPMTIRPADPLLVCGWHARIGSLAVFADARVTALSQVVDDDVVPISITHANNSVQPGFLLNDSEAVIITSSDGNEATLYGNNGAYFIAASYDPFENSGYGQFQIVIGYDLDPQTNSQQECEVSSAQPVRLVTSLSYCNIEVVSNPAKNSTELDWNPNDGFGGSIDIEYFHSYRLSHTLNGQVAENQTQTGEVTYQISESALTEL